MAKKLSDWVKANRRDALCLVWAFALTVLLIDISYSMHRICKQTRNTPSYYQLDDLSSQVDKVKRSLNDVYKVVDDTRSSVDSSVDYLKMIERNQNRMSLLR